jgi:hypothetical protein
MRVEIKSVHILEILFCQPKIDPTSYSFESLTYVAVISMYQGDVHLGFGIKQTIFYFY